MPNNTSNTTSASSSQGSAVSTEPKGGLRQLIEGIVCLAIAVTLFRTFEVEGYMISTGSMAPCLLGYHNRVVCPTCQYPFTHGAAFDQALPELGAADPDFFEPEQKLTNCPNCGQRSIDITEVPRNQGDQLLVYKNAYLIQPPRRWEIIVFRNPHQPTQAYVKRVVGLPGEEIQIIDGDVYADGKIQRKDLVTQRSMRIPVYDHDYQPHNVPEAMFPWIPEPGDIAWKPDGTVFVLDPPPADSRDDSLPSWSWVNYRHRIRSRGSSHQTSVRVDPWPEGLELPTDYAFPLAYDPETKLLTCTGILPAEVRDQLLKLADEPNFVRALRQLDEDSHFGPITDLYGYNQEIQTSYPVRDLMLAARVRIEDGTGQFVLRMTDGDHTFDCLFDAGTRQAQLLIENEQPPLRTADLPAKFLNQPALIEMSLIDRQVLVALDGELLFDPLEYPAVEKPSPAPRQPVRFGARDLRMRVDSLKLYRDVYYTGGQARHGVEEPYRLGPSEYFVLGDNSPFSFDSRSWPDPAVGERLLLGKPFLVHLPSRPSKIKIGSWNAHLRIPDFSRIRYIP